MLLLHNPIYGQVISGTIISYDFDDTEEPVIGTDTSINIILEREAIINGTQGSIFVLFVIDNEGRLKDIEMLRRLEDKLINQNILSAFKSMPELKCEYKWPSSFLGSSPMMQSDGYVTAEKLKKIGVQCGIKTRTHLNRELITPPDGVVSRTEAIQHRIDTAGITRKISHNQVRAIRVMLSGSPEDMQRIEAAGKLDEWCNDNLDWLKQTFGSDNLVSAVLHKNEKTLHTHATVVPIVTCERRKAKTAKPEDGKKIGLAVESVKSLLAGKTLTSKSFSFFLHNLINGKTFQKWE